MCVTGAYTPKCLVLPLRFRKGGRFSTQAVIRNSQESITLNRKNLHPLPLEFVEQQFLGTKLGNPMIS
jgi:hypothetical protein